MVIAVAYTDMSIRDQKLVFDTVSEIQNRFEYYDDPHLSELDIGGRVLKLENIRSSIMDNFLNAWSPDDADKVVERIHWTVNSKIQEIRDGKYKSPGEIHQDRMNELKLEYNKLKATVESLRADLSE